LKGPFSLFLTHSKLSNLHALPTEPAKGLLWAGLLMLLLASTPSQAQLPYETEYPPIGYGEVAPQDSFSQLMETLEAEGKVLEFANDGSGFLDSLLAALDIDPSSQVLVFSKTSIKQRFINSKVPRSLFFNDEVYVGFVPGSRTLEIAAMDPQLGPVFFDFSQQAEAEPRFELEDGGRCLRCHDTYALTGGGVPRFLLSSVIAGPDGNLISHELSEITDTSTPIDRRWGGWYVTGTHGSMQHRGNLIITDPSMLSHLDLTATGNIEDLSTFVDLTPYPRATSDIVALLVLQHQVELQNVLTRLNFESRTQLADKGELDAATLDTLTQPVLDSLFMANEAPLSAEVKGTSGFREYFEQQGPKDAKGRSLREFDLQTRTFKYPLSYLIYSEAVDALAAPVKQHLFARIKAVLENADAAKAYPHIDADTRTAIAEILQATKPEVLQ
jgi:hypothetical protein